MLKTEPSCLCLVPKDLLLLHFPILLQLRYQHLDARRQCLAILGPQGRRRLARVGSKPGHRVDTSGGLHHGLCISVGVGTAQNDGDWLFGIVLAAQLGVGGWRLVTAEDGGNLNGAGFWGQDEVDD